VSFTEIHATHTHRLLWTVRGRRLGASSRPRSEDVVGGPPTLALVSAFLRSWAHCNPASPASQAVRSQRAPKAGQRQRAAAAAPPDGVCGCRTLHTLRCGRRSSVGTVSQHNRSAFTSAAYNGLAYSSSPDTVSQITFVGSSSSSASCPATRLTEADLLPRLERPRARAS